MLNFDQSVWKQIKLINAYVRIFINVVFSVTVCCLFQAVARIGANLCALYDEPEQQKKFLSVITDAEWGIKLGKLEVI